MLAHVLEATADTLDESVIARLIEDRVAEHQRLEFKSELPGNAPGEKAEFARDVSAMANGGGGVLMFGVEDDEDDVAVAANLVPPWRPGDSASPGLPESSGTVPQG